MTNVLSFEGYSDDAFACAGLNIDVYKNTCASDKPVYMRVEASDGAMIVRGQYTDGPCGGWSIGVSPIGEQHIPAWPMRFALSDRPYSPMLIVEAPDDVKVFFVGEKGRR